MSEETTGYEGRRKGRRTANPTEEVHPRFEGSAYANHELQFLLEHLGETAFEAMPPDEDLPEGVNDSAVGPLLDLTYKLESYQTSVRKKNDDDELTVWCGFDALKAICTDTLRWRAQVQELKRRTKGSPAEVRRAANAPSLCLWDASTDIPYPYGVGADAERTLTALKPNGDRVELYTELQQTGVGGLKTLSSVASFLKGTKAEGVKAPDADLPEDLSYSETGTHGIVTCPLCGLAETYDINTSTTKRKAVAAIMKHLREESKVKAEQHRMLHKRLVSGRASGKRKAAGGDDGE